MATLSSSSSASMDSDRTVLKTTPMSSNSIPERKVRVVAKIRGFSETEFQKGESWISVKKPEGEASKPVIVSFGDQSTSQKDSYEIDYCYEQNEGNDSVFSREVKPLVSGVFDGCNATVFAYGAKSSGKTSLIQGSCEKPGLATLAMAEILSAAEESGKSIAISFFEVFQDRVCDLLDSKRQAVLVLEDKQGKIQLKGLSSVPVRSLLDFQNLYAGQITSKPSQKATIELPCRSHKGLIIYITCLDDPLRMGKMNFVELAGYEDVRRKSTDGQKMAEHSKSNTSVYAFLNIIHSLSTSTSHVPYRESKLARILQDSLGGPNKILMISCLSPTFCQDSLYMVKLASRSSQKVQSVALDSTKKIQNSTRPKIVSSFKSRTPKTVSAATKKPATSQRRVPLSEKKINGVLSSVSKGRKLFEEKSKLKPSNKSMCMETESLVLDSVSDVKPLADEQENITMETAHPVLDSVTVVQPLADEQEINSAGNVTSSTIVSSGNERTLTDIPQKAEQTSTSEKDNLPSDVFAFMVPKDVLAIGADGPEAITPTLDITTKTSSSSFVPDGQAIEKDDNVTPQISARLRELSNNLKALIFSPSPFALEAKNKNESINIIEPKTPMVVCSATKECKTSVHGMKSSIAQEYLKFLNTADKEELKRLRGIGEKRATWILELREESPEPFKSVDDLKNIGLVGKKLKESMTMGGLLFD